MSRHSTQIQEHKPSPPADSVQTVREKAPAPDLQPVPEEQRDSGGARVWFSIWAIAFVFLSIQILYDLAYGLLFK